MCWAVKVAPHWPWPRKLNDLTVRLTRMRNPLYGQSGLVLVLTLLIFSANNGTRAEAEPLGAMRAIGGTADEPTGTAYLPTDPTLSCPGFHILRTHAGSATESGRFGAELLLLGPGRDTFFLNGPGRSTLQGGLNFGGRATSAVRGFAAFNIANQHDEDQVVQIGLDAAADGWLRLERRSGGAVVATPIDQSVSSGQTAVSATVPPGFYVASYEPWTGASTRYAISALTSFTDRPGGGFQGGVVVGGYHDPNHAAGSHQSTAFAGFCLAESYGVKVEVLSQPTYGASGAQGMAFSVSGGDGVLYLDSRRDDASPLPGTTFQECADCPDLMVIPGGSFLMGSPEDEPERSNREGPQHTVNVPVFALGLYPVTFDEWDACVADGGCSHDPDDSGYGRGSRPVINVSWHDAQEYSHWLSMKTGQHYRLPSEAEWEYAARAGTTGRFNTGDCITTDQANFRGSRPASGCPAGVYRQQTLPVASFAPNDFGLYDTHGNVWEWVMDCYSRGYVGAPSNGSAWMAGDCGLAVMRGGSYWNDGHFLRSARRVWPSRTSRGTGGFRIARAITIPVVPDSDQLDDGGVD